MTMLLSKTYPSFPLPLTGLRKEMGDQADFDPLFGQAVREQAGLAGKEHESGEDSAEVSVAVQPQAPAGIWPG